MTTITPETYDRWFVIYSPDGPISLVKLDAGSMLGTGQTTAEEYLSAKDAVIRAMDLGLDASMWGCPCAVESDPDNAYNLVFPLDNFNFNDIQVGAIAMCTMPEDLLALGAICIAKDEENRTVTWDSEVTPQELPFELCYYNP